METNKIYKGTCLEVIKTFPDESIDCVITSPPYWQLRNYNWDGQWGLEPTFDMYLEHLWELMDEIYRVLKPTGTVWVNLGDTYSTVSGGIRGLERAKKNNNQRSISKKNIIGQGFDQKKPENMPSKCLLLIPHRFAIGAIDRGWIVRNDIIWAKRNGMPESCGDRFSKKHEYFFFMVKQEKYFFDLDAIRDKNVGKRWGGNKYSVPFDSKFNGKEVNGLNRERIIDQNGTKNPGDVSDFWDEPTRPNKESHYAQYNDRLLIKPILAGCPEFVCNNCGKPREKIIETKTNTYSKREEYGEQPTGNGHQSSTGWEPSEYEVTGYTDCGCGAGFSGGVILDPFSGSGTTLLTGLRANRRVIGIEGSDEYFDMSSKRLAIALSAPTLL